MPHINNIVSTLQTKDEYLQFKKSNLHAYNATTDTFNIGDKIYLLQDMLRIKWTITKFTLSSENLPFVIIENENECIAAKLTDIAYFE